jgi:hypothetical protein
MKKTAIIYKYILPLTKGKRPLQKQEILIYRTNLIFMLAEPVNEYL